MHNHNTSWPVFNSTSTTQITSNVQNQDDDAYTHNKTFYELPTYIVMIFCDIYT